LVAVKKAIADTRARGADTFTFKGKVFDSLFGMSPPARVLL
jgi:hypothetical protein